MIVAHTYLSLHENAPGSSYRAHVHVVVVLPGGL